MVASLARPGGNLTGINFFSAELIAKRLELMRMLVPAATRVAVLVNPVNVSSTESTLRDAESAARVMGQQIKVLSASTSGQIDTAFATFLHERPDALLWATTPSWTADASSWSNWRTSIASLRHFRGANMPRSVG